MSLMSLSPEPQPAALAASDAADRTRLGVCLTWDGADFVVVAPRAAKKKPVDTWDLADLGIQPRRSGVGADDAGLAGGPGSGLDHVDAGEAGRELAAWLVDNRLV